MRLLVGTVLSVTVLDVDGALPRTQFWIDTNQEQVLVTLPGTNGAPPVVVHGVPQIEPGSRWQLQLVEAGAGLVPRGLGDGMVRLDAAPPYNLNGLTYAPEQLPRVMWLDEAGIPGVEDADAEALVLEALERWTEVSCSTFSYDWGGWTDAGIAEDGLDVIRWESEVWEWGDGVAGFAMTRFEEDGDSVRPSEADLLLNAVDWSWDVQSGDIYASSPTLHVGSVLTHELGHVTGMDHNYDDPAVTMFYAYIGGYWMETLSGDDRRGLCENYPAGVSECALDSDCGEGRYCLSLDGVAVCEEERADVGDFCSRVDYNCDAFCVFTDDFALEGYCSAPCESDEDCLEGWRCEDPGVSAFPDPSGGACLTDTPPWTVATVDSGDPVDSGDTGVATEPEGCGCAASEGPTSPPVVWGAGALLGAALRRRRGRGKR